MDSHARKPKKNNITHTNSFTENFIFLIIFLISFFIFLIINHLRDSGSQIICWNNFWQKQEGNKYPIVSHSTENEVYKISYGIISGSSYTSAYAQATHSIFDTVKDLHCNKNGVRRCCAGGDKTGNRHLLEKETNPIMLICETKEMIIKRALSFLLFSTSLSASPLFRHLGRLSLLWQCFQKNLQNFQKIFKRFSKDFQKLFKML